MKTVWVVAGALVREDGRILLTSRPEGKEFAGFWEFPGGKIEADELPETALARELREELAVEVDEKTLEPVTFVSFPYKTFHLVMLLYVCRCWKGMPIPQEKQQAEFIEVDFLGKSHPLPPADTVLVARLKNYLSY